MPDAPSGPVEAGLAWAANGRRRSHQRRWPDRLRSLSAGSPYTI